MKMKRFKANHKFRIISGGVSFYCTAKQIRYGVGDFEKFNAATQKALDALEYQRSSENLVGAATVGLSGTWEGMTIQINYLREDNL